MDRKQALELVKENIKNKNLIKHCLAVEAGMINMAKFFNEDEEKWGLCGLLHDIDYENVKEDPSLHSKVGSEMLRNLGVERDICDAILTHNKYHGIKPKDLMAKALYCLDPLTGLIVASTLVLPSKKLKDLKVKSILKRFREKSFARNVSRQTIEMSKEYLGMELEEFVEIILSAMQGISSDLEL